MALHVLFWHFEKRKPPLHEQGQNDRGKPRWNFQHFSAGNQAKKFSKQGTIIYQLEEVDDVGQNTQEEEIASRHCNYKSWTPIDISQDAEDIIEEQKCGSIEIKFAITEKEKEGQDKSEEAWFCISA